MKAEKIDASKRGVLIAKIARSINFSDISTKKPVSKDRATYIKHICSEALKASNPK